MEVKTSTMVSELYDALKEAGASEGKAQAAAIAIADYDKRFAIIHSDLLLLKWMVGFNLAFSTAIASKLFL